MLSREELANAIFTKKLEQVTFLVDTFITAKKLNLSLQTNFFNERCKQISKKISDAEFDHIKHPHPPIAFYLYPIHLAVENGDPEIVKQLLRVNEININIYSEICWSDVSIHGKPSETALCIAIQKGNLEIFKLLINANANPNLHGNYYDETRIKSPLELAFENDQLEMMKILLDTKNIKLESVNKVLQIAKTKNNDEVIKLLDEFAKNQSDKSKNFPMWNQPNVYPKSTITQHPYRPCLQ